MRRTGAALLEFLVIIVLMAGPGCTEQKQPATPKAQNQKCVGLGCDKKECIGLGCDERAPKCVGMVCEKEDPGSNKY